MNTRRATRQFDRARANVISMKMDGGAGDVRLIAGEAEMKLLTEFKAFIRRGNVVELAVGVIMGAAFGKIVNSLVADVLMPPIGYIVGRRKFTDLKVTLPGIDIPDPLSSNPLQTLEPVTVNIGSFLQATSDFLIISMCVFAIIKGITALRHAENAGTVPPPEPTPTEKLLIEIRDLLKYPSTLTNVLARDVATAWTLDRAIERRLESRGQVL